MIKTLNKNFVILLFVFVSASIFRWLFDKNEYINNIIAVVNVVSFIYVRFLIIDTTKIYFCSLLDNANHLGDKVKEKKKQHFKVKTNRHSICVIIFGIIYVLLLANAITNDIIGFAALFMSLQSDYIAELTSKMIFKKK